MVEFDLETFKEISLWPSIPEEYLAGDLEESLAEDRFPGFILPAQVRKKICWYAIAVNQQEWRALQPILTAFVGHTVTTFDGEPTELDPDINIEAFLLSQNVHAVARLVPSQDVKLAVRALARMKETLLARPKDLRPPQMSTATMISHFDMCLVEGDRDGALHWLTRLKNEFRLDALNINFTRVKLHANFREWRAILADPFFPELCRVKKPQSIAHHLLEALWYIHIEGLPEEVETRQSAFEEHCKSFAEDILAVSGFPSDWSASAFKELFLYEDGGDERTPPVVDQVVSETISKRRKPDSKGGWLEWIHALHERYFPFKDSAEDLALDGNAGLIDDPEDVSELEEALFDLSSGRELERLEQALPYIIQWLKKDDGYPRKLLSPLYEIALLRLIETQNRDGEFREGISEMFAAILEVGMNADRYKNLLKDVAHSIPGGAGTSDVFWLLDISEVLCRFSAPEESMRNTLLNQILASLQPIMHQLSSLQRSAFESVAATAGWDPLVFEESEERGSIAEFLKGKLVGIYTLTERAGRQAGDAIKKIAPDVKVEISSDKVCTPRLTKLSQNADFMIVTASSAKHAATDCIRAQRDADQILYAAGRGYCSILRSLEDRLEAVS